MIVGEALRLPFDFDAFLREGKPLPYDFGSIYIYYFVLKILTN